MKSIRDIISETIDNYLKLPNYLYHATPSCYVESIKKYGLGGKIPDTRFWDYEDTPYSNIKRGCFLASDEYVAESYVESSDAFDDLSDLYEKKYNKKLEIIVFQINTKDLIMSQLSVDTNQIVDDESEITYFYDGIIPYNKLKIIKL